MASGSRGRAKKVGLSRMDAAFDHLQPFGFTRQQISSTVKSLLKEYGGVEGWYFLEENNYDLVLQTILNNQNAMQEEPPLSKLLAAPPPSQEEKEEELEQNGDSDEELGMEEQRNSNGGGSSEVTTLVPVEIQFMDERLLHVIPPGRCRPPFYGYLSETDSDFDAEFDADHLSSP